MSKGFCSLITIGDPFLSSYFDPYPNVSGTSMIELDQELDSKLKCVKY